jgi:hypothetical protein
MTTSPTTATTSSPTTSSPSTADNPMPTKAAPNKVAARGSSTQADNPMPTKSDRAVHSSANEFLALPFSDTECDSVDSKNGLWVKCAVCSSIMNNKVIPPRPSNIIATRAGRPFTIARWTSHKSAESHKKSLGRLKQSGLEDLESNGTIDRFDQASLTQMRKKQKTIQFLPMTKTPFATTTATDTTCHAADSMTTRTNTCEGIIRSYRLDAYLQEKIDAYVKYCAISSSAIYVAGKVISNGLSQVFAQSCTPNKVTFQKNGKAFLCPQCFDVL